MHVDKAIVVENVSKKYTLYESTKERLVDLFSPKSVGEPFYALRNVNFVAEHGEVIGFIGTNGSGKSTLSNIIAGIVPETSGKVTVNGEAALIAVSAGLKNDLTGRDNIELKLLMLGFNKKEILELEEDIIEFSELGQFIDQPVKSYSSGMKSRLGFSISVNVDPDILIIDEALSVGDRAFSEKSLNKMIEFKEEGKTMIFVSHSLGQMKKFCDKILWLEFGKVKAYGDVAEIMPQYEEFLNMWKKLSKKEREKYKEKAINDTLDYERFLEKVEEKEADKYEEKLVSKIARLRKGELPVYNSPKELAQYESDKPYKKQAYYVKKLVTTNDDKFLLLSTKPSAVDGVIGWMKAADVRHRNHIQIDTDSKEFIIKGTGKALSKPWGASHDIIQDDLAPFENEVFQVFRTDKVGKNEWYCGRLNGQDVWIHQNHLKPVSTQS